MSHTLPDSAAAYIAEVLPQDADKAQVMRCQRAHIAWRTMVHDYRRGTPVRIIGRGLRSSARRAQKVLLLDSTDSVQLLTPPFDGLAAAAGSNDA